MQNKLEPFHFYCLTKNKKSHIEKSQKRHRRLDSNYWNENLLSSIRKIIGATAFYIVSEEINNDKDNSHY